MRAASGKAWLAQSPVLTLKKDLRFELPFASLVLSEALPLVLTSPVRVCSANLLYEKVLMTSRA